MASYAVELHQEDSERSELPPIGTRAELRAAFLDFNTAAETNAPEETELYGPGIKVSFPPYTDPVTQFELSEDDPDISKAVLLRIARAFNWDLIDIGSGRRLHMYRPPVTEVDS